MDPYEFARQQGQTIGAKTDESADQPADANDLMDLLLAAYIAAGHLTNVDEHNVVVGFAQFSNDYLDQHRVVSTGVVDGVFSLVFQNGQAVPLASAPPAAACRVDLTVPITRPQDSKMKGMSIVDNSVPMTTGTVGSPVRRPK